jgi:hypothetical protein
MADPVRTVISVAVQESVAPGGVWRLALAGIALGQVQ